MPDEQTPSPAAEPAASQPTVSGPQPAPADQPTAPSQMFAFSKIFENATEASESSPVADVSNGATEASPPPANASAPDAEPAPEPSEGVSASEAPAPGQESAQPEKAPSRREQERLDHEQKIAELSAKVAAYESPEHRQKLRDEVQTELSQQASTGQEQAKARADAERFARLNSTPDADLSQEDYTWREEQKELRSKYPQVVRAVQADAERYVQEQLAAAQQQSERAVQDGWSVIQKDIVAQIDASVALPQVDKASFKQPGTTWQRMAEQIHAAGATWKEGQLTEQVSKAEDRAAKAESEAARVSKENEDLRAEIARDRRMPAAVGRTAGAAPTGHVFDPSRGWRGNLQDAFATNGTG